MRIQSVFRMIKPKKRLKKLRKLKLSQQMEKFFHTFVARSQHQKLVVGISRPLVERYFTTLLHQDLYLKSQKRFHINVIEAHFSVVSPISSFLSKRLSLAVRNIQSLFEHSKAIQTIVSHKYASCCASQIQRFYRKHYSSRVSAANLIKRYIKNYLY